MHGVGGQAASTRGLPFFSTPSKSRRIINPAAPSHFVAGANGRARHGRGIAAMAPARLGRPGLAAALDSASGSDAANQRRVGGIHVSPTRARHPPWSVPTSGCHWPGFGTLQTVVQRRRKLEAEARPEKRRWSWDEYDGHGTRNAIHPLRSWTPVTPVTPVAPVMLSLQPVESSVPI